jgi:GNAT superfamily N-acetyltransferase
MLEPFSFEKDGFTISTDPKKLDLLAIHDYLTHRSYWSEGIPFEIMQRSFEHSLCFGVYENNQQVGFARVITDRTTFAYLADVFILEPYRGRGLSKWLLQCIMRHPDLQGLRRWGLVTRDAHGLYAQFGFTSLKHPEWMMEISHPEIYKNSPSLA